MRRARTRRKKDDEEEEEDTRMLKRRWKRNHYKEVRKSKSINGDNKDNDWGQK